MKNLGKNIFFWLIVGSLAFMLLENYQMGASKEELSFTEFKNEVKAKKVKSIVINYINANTKYFHFI